MKETGLTGKRRSTTIAATPDDGKSQRKRRRRRLLASYLQGLKAGLIGSIHIILHCNFYVYMYHHVYD